MDELAGGSRRADPPPSPPPLPLLPEDMLVEILLRLPPEPIHLFRASFVSKHWRSLAHDARFLRRFREFHGGTPPVLGFFSNQHRSPLFVPTSRAFAVPAAATMRHDDWLALDCRRGRALLLDRRDGRLLVWDPMNGYKRYVQLPTQAHLEGDEYNGAVLCAAGHAGHGDCHSCPFLVALTFGSRSDSITSACVYSSKTRVWGEITSIHTDSMVDSKPSALVGNTLYWRLDNDSIIEFDLDKNSLDLIELPHDGYVTILLAVAEDGCLGFARLDRFRLHLWSRASSIDGVVSWTHRRVVDLHNLLAPEVVAAGVYPEGLAGYAEDANVIFIGVHPHTYMIHLKSMQIERLERGIVGWFNFPYRSFYTPAPGVFIVFDVPYIVHSNLPNYIYLADVLNYMNHCSV